MRQIHALSLSIAVFCSWVLCAPRARAIGGHRRSRHGPGRERRGHPGLDRHHHQRVDRRRPNRRQRAQRRLRGPLPRARRLRRPGRPPGLPRRSATAVTLRVGQTGAPELRAAGRQRSAKSSTSTPRGLLLETQSGVTGNVVTDGDARQPAAERPQLHPLGNLTAGVVASGDAVPRQRRARHVSAGVVRRRQRAQQPRQQPVHVPVGGRGRGVQGAGDQLHRGVRRARRRQRAAAAQVGHQRLPRLGLRVPAQRRAWTPATSSRRRRARSRSSIGISSAA